MSYQPRELTPEERLALHHEVGRRGVGPIDPVAHRILHLWNAHWAERENEGRPISPEGRRDADASFDRRLRGGRGRTISLDTTVAARTEDGGEVMLAERLTAHGVLTAKSAPVIGRMCEDEQVDQIDAGRAMAAYHTALTCLPPWARELLDLVAAGKSMAEISTATGLAPRTLTRRMREAEDMLRTRILWPNDPISSTIQ